jgi:prepilin-type processing-associated H-X9-DG protein
MTPLELMVVVAVLALLCGLIVPALSASREAARNLQCEDNLNQLGIALQMHVDLDKRLPAGWRVNSDNVTAYGWAYFLLPEIEESKYLIGDERPAICGLRAARTLPMFLCPSDPADSTFDIFKELDAQKEQLISSEWLGTLPQSNYIGVFGNADPDLSPAGLGEGVFVRDHQFAPSQITRGQNNVLAVGERTARKLPSTWVGTYLNGEDAASRVVGMANAGLDGEDLDESEFDSRHFGHANFLWCDGHVAGISEEIDLQTYRALARRDLD